MKTMVILVGNIGSGKTTTTKMLSKEGYIIVARDAFRYMIGGGNYIFNPRLEPLVHEMYLSSIIHCLDEGLDIVIDETNMTRAIRSNYISLGYERDYSIVCLEMPRYSKRYCVDRRMRDPHGQNDRKVWTAVWEGFNSRYQPPSYQEGFNYIVKLAKGQKTVTLKKGCTNVYSSCKS